MKLTIAQIILEEARFGHAGQFLAKESSTRVAPHKIDLEIGTLDVGEPGKAVVRLTVKNEGPESPQYLFLVKYLILFTIEDYEEGDSELTKRLAVTGATMLMPFVRELVGNLTMRGRFGQLWLPPINFGDAVSKSAAKPRRSRVRKTEKTEKKGG